MKTLRWLLAVAILIVAVVAYAIPRTFTGTIDTPAVLVWVAPNGNIVAPFAGAAGNVYLDPNTGIVWTLTAAGSSQPYLIDPQGFTAQMPLYTVGQYYTTADCSGQIYIAVLQSDPAGSIYVFSNNDGRLCAPAGSPLAIANFYSEQKSSGCIVSTTPIPSNYYVYVAAYVTSALPTPPTLPAGPYHLELR